MKKITIQFPPITIAVNEDQAHLLPILKDIVEREMNTPRWSFVIQKTAKQIVDEAIEKFQDSERLLKNIKITP